MKWIFKFAGVISPLSLMMALMGCEGSGSDGGGDDTSPQTDTNQTSSITNKAYVYVVLGDGISTGVGLPAGESPWPVLLKTMMNRKVYNESKAHSKVNYGVGQADYVIQKYRPGHLLVLLGSNDVGLEENSDYIVGQLLTIVQKAKAQSVIPVVATLPPIYGRDYDMVSRLQRVNSKIRAMASSEAIPLVDVASEFGDDETLFLDGLHPTAWGQQIIAQTFYDAL